LNERFLNSDEYLIRRLKEDDNHAFELVFNKFKDKLYYFTLGYLHSSHETEEIIQNVFVSLWENRYSLKEEFSLKSFLYKITVNHIYNHLKHEVVRQKYVDHIVLNESNIEDDRSEESIFYNDLRNTIDTLIGELPVRQQTIFKLSRKEGLSHVEIAQRLGVSVRSVENHIYRVLKHIREKLRNEHLLTE
jgi:RNA polymerase sigma-70 factor (ECF subfamily)